MEKTKVIEEVETEGKCKYTVEFTCTVEVWAEDALEAYEKAVDQVNMDDMYVYVDGDQYI